jgi:hypothetical protein
MRQCKQSNYPFRTLSGLVGLGLLAGLMYASRPAEAQSLGAGSAEVSNASGSPADAMGDDHVDADATAVDRSPAPSGEHDDEGRPGGDDRMALMHPTAADNGQVLEVPQVLGPADLGGENRDQEASGANSDDTPTPDQDDSGALDEDGTGVPAEVGSLADYENQATPVPMGVMVYGPGMAAPMFANRLGANRLPLPISPTGPIMRAPIILPPTSSGPFPSTSPMLMSPGMRSPALPGPGGLWLRSRR